MRTLLAALLVVMCSYSAFAAQDTKPAGPKAQSQSMTVTGSTVNFSYLQDGESGSPGFTWEKELSPNFVAGIAAVYRLSGDKIASGPVIGYRLIPKTWSVSKYFNVTPMLGVLQDIGATKSTTRFSYGIEASVDLTALFPTASDPVAVNRSRASMATLTGVEDPTLSMGGLGGHLSYSRFGVGGGADYVFPLMDSVGVGVSASVVRDRNNKVTFAPGADVFLHLWGDKNNSVSLFGGADYNCGRKAVSPVFGVTWRNKALDF